MLIAVRLTHVPDRWYRRARCVDAVEMAQHGGVVAPPADRIVAIQSAQSNVEILMRKLLQRRVRQLQRIKPRGITLGPVVMAVSTPKPVIPPRKLSRR